MVLHCHSEGFSDLAIQFALGYVIAAIKLLILNEDDLCLSEPRIKRIIGLHGLVGKQEKFFFSSDIWILFWDDICLINC